MARLVVVFGVITLISCSAYGQSIIIEAETYVASHDVGGTTIYVTSCSGASGGLAVDGFDTVGEWIEVVLNIPSPGAYADSLRSAGLPSAESDIRSTVFDGSPGGGDLTSAFHTVGLGIG